MGFNINDASNIVGTQENKVGDLLNNMPASPDASLLMNDNWAMVKSQDVVSTAKTAADTAKAMEQKVTT